MTVVLAVSFFLFERYVDEAALEAHAASAHFGEIVVGEAVPRLAQRQRTMLVPLV